MRHSKILALASKQNSKAFSDIRLGQPRHSLDPSAPPLYYIDVSGQRADGIVFTITVQIDKQKYDALNSAGALNVAVLVLNDGLKKLMEFLGCGCTKDEECEKHQRGAVN